MLAMCGYNKRAKKCKAPKPRGAEASTGWEAAHRRADLRLTGSDSSMGAGRGSVAIWRSQPRRYHSTADVAQLRVRGDREDGLSQALALEAAASQLGVGHLGQQFEARSVRVRLLDHCEQSIEIASKGPQSGGDNADGVGNEQTEHRSPSNSGESIGIDIT